MGQLNDTSSVMNLVLAVGILVSSVVLAVVDLAQTGQETEDDTNTPDPHMA